VFFFTTSKADQKTGVFKKKEYESNGPISRSDAPPRENGRWGGGRGKTEKSGTMNKTRSKKKKTRKTWPAYKGWKLWTGNDRKRNAKNRAVTNAT